ncbi:unnamed protein product, partial [Brassica oleracea]
ISIQTLVANCFWFLLVSSFAGANKADVNCLRNFKSGVTDPNDYLSSWVFDNQTAGFICKFSGVTCWHIDENRVLSIKVTGFGLKGEFPVGIKQCSVLVGLELSRNNFSGVLPTNIGSLKNNFTGPLPPELVSLPRLTKFSVAFNQLTGPVPNFNLKFGRENFSSNEGLCGQPMDPCVDPEEDIIRLGKIGAAVGAALFAPLGAFLDWFVFSGRKKKQEDRRHHSWIFHIGD